MVYMLVMDLRQFAEFWMMQNLSSKQKVGAQHLVGLRWITFASTLGPPQPVVVMVKRILSFDTIMISHDKSCWPIIWTTCFSQTHFRTKFLTQSFQRPFLYTLDGPGFFTCHTSRPLSLANFRVKKLNVAS